MSCQRNLDLLITAEADRRGVPPTIALQVANTESGRCHWDKNGNVKRGKAGEVGVFQVMPSTGRGFDLFDVQQNIAAGIGYLAQMYRQFGTWPLAIAAYNCGPECARESVAGERNFPASTIAYVNGIFGRGAIAADTGVAFAKSVPSSSPRISAPFTPQTSEPSPALLAGGTAFGLLTLALLLRR